MTTKNPIFPVRQQAPFDVFCFICHQPISDKDLVWAWLLPLHALCWLKASEKFDKHYLRRQS